MVQNIFFKHEHTNITYNIRTQTYSEIKTSGVYLLQFNH